MKELLIFQLRYRKKAWIFCTLISTLMVLLFSIQTEQHGWFMLILVGIYSGLIDKLGAKKNLEEFIPRLALPFGKRAFIAYMLVRNVLFYLFIGILTIIVLITLHTFIPKITVPWEIIPFMILFYTAIQSLTLMIDCVTSMTKGSIVSLVIMLFTIPGSDPFSKLIAKAAPKGAYIPLKLMNAMTNDFYQWALNFPGQSILLALCIGAVAGAFSLFRAKRIRF